MTSSYGKIAKQTDLLAEPGSIHEQELRLSDTLRFACEIANLVLSEGINRSATLNADRYFERLSIQFKCLTSQQQLDCFLLACCTIKRGLPKLIWQGQSFTPCSEQQSRSVISAIEHKTPEQLLQWLNSLSQDLNGKMLIVVDKLFAEYHSAFMAQAIAVQKTLPILIQSTESAKNPQTAIGLLKNIEEQNSSVKVIVSLGGGICSDVAGFVAGLYKLPYYVVPTTYLAAVDAGQGGKTGVNFAPFGKNQLGLFVRAEKFILCEPFFETLPLEERISGLCEALKHCVLWGNTPEWLNEIQIAKDKYFVLPTEFLLWNLQVKTAVVKADPFEKEGLRQMLNFGHTIGHVWEGLSDAGLATKLTHGAAVALGILFLQKQGWINNIPKNLENLLRCCALYFQPRIRLGQQTKHLFLQLICGDKKNESMDKVLFIVPQWGCLASLTNTSAPKSAHGSDLLIDPNEPQKPLDCSSWFLKISPEDAWNRFEDFCQSEKWQTEEEYL